MLFDGIILADGSTASNLAIVSGDTFPLEADIGELFYLADGVDDALYVYSGTQWDRQITSDTVASALDADLQAIATLAGTSGILTKTATDTWSLDTTVYLTGEQPISNTTGLQGALDAKQATLVSGTNIKSINGTSLLGSGDLVLATAVKTVNGVDISGTGDINGALYGLAMSRTGKDTENIYTTISFKRADGTLARQSILSGGTSPEYTTRTESLYGLDGTTVTQTLVFTLTYDSGELVSEDLA